MGKVPLYMSQASGRPRVGHLTRSNTTLETTQGQIDGFFSQLPSKCDLQEVASVGDGVKICPWVASRVVYGKYSGSMKITTHLDHISRC